MSSHHRILGVPANSSLLQIKRAYFKKAKVLHPDVNKSPNAEEEFVRLNMAYEALTNPKYVSPPIIQVKRNRKTKAQLKREWVIKRNAALRERALEIAKHKRNIRRRNDRYYNSGSFAPIASFFIAIFLILISFQFLDKFMNPGIQTANGAILIALFLFFTGVSLIVYFCYYFFHRFFK